MARNFNGTGDVIDFGSDAAIDGFTTKTIAMWINLQTPAASLNDIATKSGAGYSSGWGVLNYTVANLLAFVQAWSSASGQWSITSPSNGRHHIAITYTAANTSDDPIFYVDGTTPTVTENAAPSGTLLSDAAFSTQLSSAGSGLVASISHYVYTNTVMTAAEVNRHRWWGRPHGGLVMYHPFLTTKTANEGTATATASLTGTTMVSLVTPVQRPGSGGGFGA